MKRFTVVLALAALAVLGAGQVSLAQHTHEQPAKKANETGRATADTTATPRLVDSKVTASINLLVQHYLHLKNALTNDKPKDAATAGKAMVDAMGIGDKSLLTAEQKKLYEEIEEDAKEHAEHIAENAGNIEHQREHFSVLSNDMYDLVQAFGAGQVLYKNFCPMYNDKKGAPV